MRKEGDEVELQVGEEVPGDGEGAEVPGLEEEGAVDGVDAEDHLQVELGGDGVGGGGGAQEAERVLEGVVG